MKFRRVWARAFSAAFVLFSAFLLAPAPAFATGTPGANANWTACWPDSTQTSGIKCLINGAATCTFGAGTSSCSYNAVSGASSSCSFSGSTLVCVPHGSATCYIPQQPPPAGDIHYNPGATICYPIAPQAQLTISPPAQGFGEQLLGTQSAPVTFMVRNNGGQAATMNGASVHSAAFALLSDGCSFTMLQPAQTCPLVVAFQPGAAQSYSTTLEVDYYPFGTSRVSFLFRGLSGTGVTQYSPPILSFPQTSLQPYPFPSTQYGVAGPGATLSVQNDGYSPLTISNITFSGPEYFSTGGTCAGATLAPRGGQCAIFVQFVPAAIGPRSGTMTVFSNASNSPSVYQLGGGGNGPVFNSQPIDDVNAGGEFGNDDIAHSSSSAHTTDSTPIKKEPPSGPSSTPKDGPVTTATPTAASSPAQTSSSTDAVQMPRITVGGSCAMYGICQYGGGTPGDLSELPAPQPMRMRDGDGIQGCQEGALEDQFGAPPKTQLALLERQFQFPAEGGAYVSTRYTRVPATSSTPRSTTRNLRRSVSPWCVRTTACPLPLLPWSINPWDRVGSRTGIDPFHTLRGSHACLAAAESRTPIRGTAVHGCRAPPEASCSNWRAAARSRVGATRLSKGTSNLSTRAVE